MKNIFVILGLMVCKSSVAAALTLVSVQTNMGTFEVELNDEKAPITVANFLQYVDSQFYDQTIIHRVVKNFVIQGGGLDQNLVEKPTREPIINEATNGLSNLKGTIGMAREEEPNSATAQFYFNTKDNLKLDHTDLPGKFGYAVFGRVTKGYEVVEAIENLAVHTVGEYEDVPVQTVIIQKIARISAAH